MSRTIFQNRSTFQKDRQNWLDFTKDVGSSLKIEPTSSRWCQLLVPVATGVIGWLYIASLGRDLGAVVDGAGGGGPPFLNGDGDGGQALPGR